MANSISYLMSRSNFLQVSPDIPITKQRNPDKYDSPDVFEGGWPASLSVNEWRIVSVSEQDRAST